VVAKQHKKMKKFHLPTKISQIIYWLGKDECDAMD